MSSPVNMFQGMPNEIFHEILSYLSLHELSLASRVCKFWHAEGNDPHLWKALYIKKYPDADLNSLQLETIKNTFKNRIQEEQEKLKQQEFIYSLNETYWSYNSASFD